MVATTLPNGMDMTTAASPENLVHKNQKQQQQHTGLRTATTIMSSKAHNEILRQASFETQKGVKILKMSGTPYEMGYQHGYLLADRIQTMVTKTVLALPAFIASLTGKNFEEALEVAVHGQKAAEPFLPTEFREEMQGIVDGAQAAALKSKGAVAEETAVTLQQILLWNTYYDQWCLYCHPHFYEPGTGSNSNERKGKIVFGCAGGCSSFSAWDHAAGGDGKLIMGKNEDNFNMPGQEENRIMVVAKPNLGYGHVFMTYPGLIGLDGGMNEAGLEMMTHLNSMMDETMAGCGIGVFTRLLLTHVSTVQGAIQVFENHPRCAGIAFHVASGKAKEAAVVETSADHVCVRYPKPNSQVLWQANHSNCYPGWEGYDGYNMVDNQKEVNELQDISTIEKWQQSLRDPKNGFVQAPSRFERYRTLLEDTHYGRITPDIAQAILSDCVDPYADNYERGRDEPSVSNNIKCTICALYPDMDFVAPEPLGNFKARIANNWSMVAYPETGSLWLAIQDFPAQNGGYEHFNVHELLSSKQ
jgi:hypothetical protein